MKDLKNREPAVAGKFYSDNEQELLSDLKTMFGKAKRKLSANVQAIISPHAGYVFSGEVAANSFYQIDKERVYKNIFLIGTSHQLYLHGASIYNIGNYISPLGQVKVNIELANRLIEDNDCFEFDKNAHINEHSNEVQLPFLQYILEKDFRIVPIIIGTQSPIIIEEIAKVLQPYFTEDNLFVISTDFSHYPDYKSANEIDEITANSILANSTDKFLKILEENKLKNIYNHATSVCGWTSVLTLLYLTENNPKYKYQIIDYKNSGDAMYGDKSSVVGYYSIICSIV